MHRQVHGILLLDKPIGLTSNAVLQRVKRLFKAKKAGHTGSLDPIASGMLPICFGEGTKFSQFLLSSDKSYHVIAKLGEQTTTGDSEGKVIATTVVENLMRARVEQVINQYVGTIEQIPPMFSAIKYKGKPLYKLARQGIEVERVARPVTIFSIQLESIEADFITLQVHCSKGTYIRTLIEDIGRDLGYGAHVIGLRRLSVHPYHDGKMYTLADLEALASQHLDTLTACLLPLASSVTTFPMVSLPLTSVFYLRTGQAIRTASLPTNLSKDQTFVSLYDENNQFLGVGEVTSDGRVKPYRLLGSLDKQGM